jgi:N-acetylglucosamine-6-sulfatase
MLRKTRLLAAATAVGLAAGAGISVAVTDQAGQPAGVERAGVGAKRPNIIYFQVDDLSPELLQYMDNVQQLASEHGSTFANHVISNSLCCPSRASMFTGLFPHNTGVLTNGQPDGGHQAFQKWENRTYAHVLHGAGYRTGYLGKYLNGYKVGKHEFTVPDGKNSWDEWHVANGGGYNEYDYDLTRYIREKGVRSVGDGNGRYLVDVLADRAGNFIDRSGGKPFFLQVAPFSPHSGQRPGEPRFPAAKRDRPGGQFPHGDCGGVDCRTVDVTKLGAFDENTADKRNLPWIRQNPLTEDQVRQLQTDFRNRVRMVQSIDDMVGTVLRGLSPEHRRNTYIVFGTDNGFHLGQHRMLRGKETAYDHDVRVPLLVKRPAGSGPAGPVVRREVVQNIDLYGTFLDIAGVSTKRQNQRDGRSLLGLIHGQDPHDWRNAALIEHRRPEQRDGDPDAEAPERRTPYSYRAVRIEDTIAMKRWSELFVQYLQGDRPREYYDRTGDRYEEHNKPQHPRTGELSGPLERLARCGGDSGIGCWEAAHIELPQ